MNPLTKKVNVPEFGVITKEEFMHKAHEAGWQISSKKLNGYQDGRYSRTKFNRLAGEEQAEYERKMNEVRNVYSIHPPEPASHFYDISRTEFEYFKQITLQALPA